MSAYNNRALIKIVFGDIKGAIEDLTFVINNPNKNERWKRKRQIWLNFLNEGYKLSKQGKIK